MKLKKRAEKLALFQHHGLGVKPAVLVAESLGMTEIQLARQCQYYKISIAYKNRRWSPSDIAKMSALRELGMKWSEVGELMGRSPKSCAVTYGKLKNETNN